MTTATPVIGVITADELRRLTEMLYEWTGMTFGENKRYYIERRIADRVKRSHSADIRAYLALLRGDPVERQALINAFTINETYFFREDHQLKALSDQILPEVVRTKRPGDLVRIWSMPCSTGDEAYSIAIWLLEHWRMVDAYNVEIVGSDIDTATLDAAREGRFVSRALSRLPAELIERYFEPEHHHRRQIIEDLRESVRFTTANIIDPVSVAAQGRFDVILCRNLLIYFDEASRGIAAANLFTSLHSGGFLCLGHSESMARINDMFDFVRLDDAIVYRRP
jgi:chemotaxis protein methyltransferase CheR